MGQVFSSWKRRVINIKCVKGIFSSWKRRYMISWGEMGVFEFKKALPDYCCIDGHFSSCKRRGIIIWRKVSVFRVGKGNSLSLNVRWTFCRVGKGVTWFVEVRWAFFESEKSWYDYFCLHGRFSSCKRCGIIIWGEISVFRVGKVDSLLWNVRWAFFLSWKKFNFGGGCCRKRILDLKRRKCLWCFIPISTSTQRES